MSTNYEVPHYAVFCSLMLPVLGPNTFLSNLFYNTANLCFSLWVRKQVSHTKQNYINEDV